MKRRLVGAAVIVLLAIIIVPAWFDGSARRLRDEDVFVVALPPPDKRIEMIDPDEIGLPLDNNVPVLEPLPEPDPLPEPVLTEEVASAEADILVTQNAQPVQNKPKKAAVKAASVAKKFEPVEIDLNAQSTAAKQQVEKASAQPNDADDLANWIVQVGSFASQDNANSMVSRLKKGKLKAFMRDFESNGDKIYRVLVGPFVRQVEADQAKQIIDERFNVKAFVANWRG